MVGDILRELREDKGYTQTELGDLLGLTRQTISAYENGTIEPTLSTLIKLADLYNCSLDYLAGRTKEMYNLNLIKNDNKKFIMEVIKIAEKYDIKNKKE